MSRIYRCQEIGTFASTEPEYSRKAPGGRDPAREEKRGLALGRREADIAQRRRVSRGSYRYVSLAHLPPLAAEKRAVGGGWGAYGFPPGARVFRRCRSRVRAVVGPK